MSFVVKLTPLFNIALTPCASRHIVPCMSFGERLKSARARRALTQKQAAKAVGVHVVTYAKWEGGRAPKTPELAAQAADALGVRLDWLVSGLGAMTGRALTKRSGS